MHEDSLRSPENRPENEDFRPRSDNETYVNLRSAKTGLNSHMYEPRPLGSLKMRIRPRARLEDRYEEYEAKWAENTALLQEALARGDQKSALRYVSYLGLICRTREYYRRQYQHELRRLAASNPRK